MNQALTLPSIGDVVDGKFRVDRKLGEGGTSTVYEVRHAITDKKFAIKWLAPELSNNELAVERFIHEARVCGRFAHPHAVQIYDICRSNASCYLLMELLEGESLEARLQRVKRFSVQAACDILLPCLEAVGAAHRLGIVHRDLKPSNIFLCQVEGRTGEVPKVLDFGISKLSFNGYDLSPVTTNTRTVIGTPLYMAPEQMRGEPAEPRFDIYALGIVLYELIAGQAPFDCDTFADLVFKVLEAQPRPLDLVAGVTPEFGAIVARAIAGEPEDRFATMAEFALALLPYSSQAGRQAIAEPELLRPHVALAPLSRAKSPTVPLRRRLALVEKPVSAGAPEARTPLEADSMHAEPPAAPANEAPVELPAIAAEVTGVEVIIASAASAGIASSVNGARTRTTTPIARAARRKTPSAGRTVARRQLAAPVPSAAPTPISTAASFSQADDSPTRSSPGKRAIAIAGAISLAVALVMAWHTLAGAPRTGTAKTEPAILRPLEPEPTALRSVPDTRTTPAPEPVAAKPTLQDPPAGSSRSADLASANAARRVTRMRAAKSRANESPSVSAQQRPVASAPAAGPKRGSAAPADSVLRIERSDFDEPSRGLSLPAAELSRQDF